MRLLILMYIVTVFSLEIIHFGTAVGLMKSVFGFFFSMADELHLRKSTGYENFLKKGVKAYEACKKKELYC